MSKECTDDESLTIDNELVKAFKAKAISSAQVERLLKWITRHIRRKHSEFFWRDADEIAGDILVEAYEQASNLNEAKFFGWLAAIARGVIADRWKAHTNLQTISRDASPVPENEMSLQEYEAIWEQIDDADNDTDLLRKWAWTDAIGTLNEEEKTVIGLRVNDQHSSKEAADAIGKSDDATRQIACRAFVKLKQQLLETGNWDLFVSEKLLSASV